MSSSSAVTTTSAESRALRASLVARGSNRLATETLSLAVPLLVYQSTRSLAWSGAVMMLEWAPRIIGIPVAGPLVDRFGSLRFLRTAETLRAAILGAALAAVVLLPDAWPLLIVTTMAAGLVGQATFVAVEKLGVEIAGGRPVAWTQSVQAGIDHGTLVVAPLAAGALSAAGAAWAVGAVLMLVLLCRRLCDGSLAGRGAADAERRADDPTAPAARGPGQPGKRVAPGAFVGPTWDGLTRGLLRIRRSPALIRLVAATAAFNLLLAVTVAVTPAVIHEEYGHGSVHVSVIWAVGGGLSVLVIALVTRIEPRVGIRRIGLVSGLFAGPAVAAAAWAPGYAGYAALVAGFLALDGAFACFLRTLRARLIPLNEFGATVSATVLLVLVPYPVAGAVVALVPYEQVPILLSVTAATTLAVMLATVPGISAPEQGTHVRAVTHRPAEQPAPVPVPPAASVHG